MYAGGIRFNENFYVSFSIDPDNGNMTVAIEMIDDEGTKHIITGAVVWDE